MFRKMNTIKARMTFLSLIIMIVTVSSIVLTEYLLQRSVNALMIDTSSFKLEEIPEGEQTDLNNKAILAQATEVFKAKQERKFVYLIMSSSGILFLGITSIYLLIRKELQPLENLRRDMDRMDFKKNKELLVLQSKRTEIVSLTNSYNQMIENLKESYDLQKRFSQDAAHELKTPITTMKASLQVNKMIHPQYDVETKELLDVVEDQLARMEQLVSGLLTISNQKELSKETIEVRPIFDKLIQVYQKSLKDKNIKVTIEGDCQLLTNRSVLTIVLKNLFENAIRYNKLDGTIFIQLNQDIIMTDSGVGIDKNEQERIFSPFYCVDESRSKSFGGLGLGLSIVKESLEQLGFNLLLSSEIGVGSTFHIVTNQSSKKEQ